MPDPTDPVGRLVVYLGSLIASKSRGEQLPVGATRRELADHRARVLTIASSPADVPTLESRLDAVQAAVEGILVAPDDGPKAERATQEAETALAGLYNLLPVSRAAIASAGTPEGKQGEGGKPLAVPAPKRSTERGEGRAKLIAALTQHHKYADGGCLNLEPIGNNALAKAAGVSPSTASAFFNDKFQGHTKYKALCRNASKLAAALKLLNDEFAPYHLLGDASSDVAATEQDDAGSE